MSDAIGDFTAFYRQYAPQVYRFAFYLSGERGDAEDITSETFARAWAAADRIESATVTAYLFTIARNLHRRSAARSNRQVPLDDTLRDRGPDPYATAETRSERQALAARLAALSDAERTALLMRADGISYDEIARALGVSPATARVRVHRARISLAAIAPSKD